ncbi:MAG: hypothetical protein Q8R71_06565 [Phenylobacterium sp.]|nr:hypothetical protein [Phenylobacterium sp.]
MGTDYSRGDLKCDGLLSEPLTVFACYGPVNAGANATQAAMKTAVAKVDSDFAGALTNWPDLKAWKFVHNYVEQPPAQIVQKIIGLRGQHPKITLELFGKEQFEAALFGLNADAIEELVGDAATDEDFRALQPDELLRVVDELMAAVDHRTVKDDDPVQVPEQKLRFNGLTAHSQGRIIQGLQNASRVAKLLQDHQDPLLDAGLAGVLKAKYLELKAQGLEPDDVLFALYDFVAGVGRPSASLDASVWSLLANFFEKCTIFEDKPVEPVEPVTS